MRRPSAGGLVVVAVLLAAATSLTLALAPMLPGSLTVPTVIIAVLGVYNLIIVSWVRPTAGRLTGWLITVGLTGAALLIASSSAQVSGLCVLTSLGWTWLLRCALLHRNLLAILSDGALLALGVAAATWAFQTGAGLTLALWSFFLVQALLPWISTSQGCTNPANVRGRFELARRRAEQALARMYQRPAA